MINNYIFTYSIIAVTALFTFYAFNKETFLGKCLFSVEDIIRQHDYYRVLSSIFIHANIGHLFFNMFTLYAFASVIELKYGLKVTAYLYFYSGLGSGILSLAMHSKELEYKALGASGAVSGIVFASIFLIPGGKIIVFPVPIPLPTWAYAVLFVYGSIYAMHRMKGGIAHDAHLGGALTGAAVAATIDYQAVSENYFLLLIAVLPIILYFVFNRQIAGFLKK
ncbi:MAG: rhomboid family intramembrane serine protease [Spirochaetes bacterium]|nr:rhomboid family intramembrane serine protease [Spirochaetota bacterium]